MNLELKWSVLKGCDGEDIIDIHAIDSDVFLCLSFSGAVLLSNGQSQLDLFYKSPSNIVTVFDTIKSYRNQFELIVLGTE
jgi:hypothetical protein